MDDLEALARSWFTAWAARDFDALADLYAVDAESVRSDGYSKGVDAIIGYAREIAEAFPDETATVQTVLVSSDAAIVEWTETATHTAPRTIEGLGTIPPTGKSFTNERVVDIFRFKDGKIVSQHEYCDLFSMLRQLGWLELIARAAAAVHRA